MLQSRLPSFLAPPSRRLSRSLGRRWRAQQPLKPSFQEGPGLSPKKKKTGPGPSWSEDQRWTQKVSVVTRAKSVVTRARGRCGSKRGMQDPREVIQTKRSQQRSRLDQIKT